MTDGNRLQLWLKKIWHDPVGSKVIASVIFIFFSALAVYVWHQIFEVRSSDRMSISSPILPNSNIILRIAIAEFKPASDKEISDTKQLRDRIVENINARKNKLGVEIEIVIVNEVIDPLSIEGDIRANKIGKDLNAQVVICGKLRHDEEYFFRPVVYNYISDRSAFEKIQIPSLVIGPDITYSKKVILKEQTINNMLDIMSYLAALAHYESKNYYLSAQIMQTIESPSADHYFIIASALYLAIIKNDTTYTGDESKKLNDVIQQLDKATKLNPDFEEAWYDKAYIHQQNGNPSAALLSIERAISLHPNSHDAWLEKSLILFDLGKRKEAMAAYQHAENIKKIGIRNQ